MKIKVLVEEVYQHVQEYDVPDDKVDEFDYQDDVQKAYEEERAVPGKGKLVYMNVNIGEEGDAEWKELWLKRPIRRPVVKIPVKPVNETVVRVLVKSKNFKTVEEMADEVRMRLMASDGEQHLETMNWQPDPTFKIKMI